MTDREQIIAIRTEIERRAKILSGTHAGRSSDVLPVLEELLSIIESMQDSSQQCGDCVRWDKKKGCILESQNTHCITDAACESYIGSTQASEVSSNITFKVLSKSKFKAGDHIKPIDVCLGSPRIIEDVCDGWYVTNQGTLDFEFEDNWEAVEEPVNEVWHDANEEQPEEYRTVVVWNPITMDGEVLTRCAEVYKERIWAYIEDLLKLSNVQRTVKNWKELVSEDLEEEVHNFSLHYHGDIVTDEDGIHLCDINESKLLEIARHFANWQKQKELERLQADGNIYSLAGRYAYEEWDEADKEVARDSFIDGYNICKQQMMKDAFTAEINYYENAVIMCQSLDGFIKEKGWHKGDKVKLILIKDE